MIVYNNNLIIDYVIFFNISFYFDSIYLHYLPHCISHHYSESAKNVELLSIFLWHAKSFIYQWNKYRLHSRVGSKRTGTPLCHWGNCVVRRPLTFPYDSGILLSHFRHRELLITLPSGICAYRCRTHRGRGTVGESGQPRQRCRDGRSKGHLGIASARRY